MLLIKQKLYSLCFSYIEARIKTAEDAIISAREASESDTKSSAGDKYETSREMLQQEISRNQSQLIESKKLLHALNAINVKNQYHTALPGALIVTDNGTFFLSISAGIIEYNNEKYFALSPSSPIGMKLKGLKTGESFTYNLKEYKVLEVA